jgi:Flp pilus assembly pilin Flp
MAHMAFDPRRATIIEAAEIATAICVGLVATLKGIAYHEVRWIWGGT